MRHDSPKRERAGVLSDPNRKVLARQRQATILTHITRAGGAEVQDLAQLVRASTATIRRDLQVLADGNFVERVHGGALPVRMRTDSREHRVPDAITPSAAVNMPVVIVIVLALLMGVMVSHG